MEDLKTNNEIIERLAKIEVKIDDIKAIKNNVDKHAVEIAEIKTITQNQQKEIDKLNEGNTWLKRAVTSSIITAVVGVIFVFIKLGIGV